MLKLWGKNHRCPDATAPSSGVGRSARCRLGFEAMEGRLMLNGDASDFVSWDAYSPDVRIALFSLNAMPLQTAPVEYVDGGFIQPATLLFGSSIHGTLDTVTTRENAFSLDVPLNTPIFNNSGSGNFSVDFSGVHLDTPAIPPIVFPGPDSDLATKFFVQPTGAGTQPAETLADEGGAIPINSILAFVGQTDSWKRGERIASLPSFHTGDLIWGVTSAVQPTQPRGIAGEWARPMMLEMSGGEPAGMRQPETSQDQPTPASDGHDDLRFRRPFSSGAEADASTTDSRAARDMNGSRRSTPTHPAEEAPSAIRRASSTPQQPVPIILASHTANARSLTQSAAVESTESAILEKSPAAGRSALNESAYAEVYDQLGASDAVGEEALFNRDAWPDSWKATPLLVILAMERIAASNSRRAKRESACNTRRPHFHSPASADMTDSV